MVRVRTLVQMRRSLPLDEEARSGIPRIATRSFDPGSDAEALLEVNNAAFWWHPEQGHWDRARLDEALGQDWVEPEGILVHEASGRDGGQAGTLDAFCWTRVHPARPGNDAAEPEPALGEIWVVASHPRVHGSHLGPAIVAAALDHLHASGLGTANLFTEADNLPALRMYERMGFHVHEQRGGYMPEATASGAAAGSGGGDR